MKKGQTPRSELFKTPKQDHPLCVFQSPTGMIPILFFFFVKVS
jgi:hypothetical protein